MYHANKAKPDGKSGKCKNCSNLATKLNYQQNKEKRKQYARKWRKENPDNRRETDFLRSYGITLEIYNQAWNIQKGVCKICGKEESTICGRSNKIRKLAVDHCHISGRFRGLLCGRCNKGIGLFKDNITYLQSAISYLDIKGEQT